MEPHYPPLIQALTSPSVYDHPVESISIIETHISYVLLTGMYAYKLKKPVDLGFVDFTTLEKRKFYCQEEIRLNTRTAPELYLGIISICGSATSPILNGTTEPIEFAVKMRQFPQEQQLDKLIDKGILSTEHFEKLAVDIAAFHQMASTASATSGFSEINSIRQRTQQNYQQLEACQDNIPSYIQILDSLKIWTTQSFVELTPILEKRKSEKIRECHGDLHLANLALIDNLVVPFDCLEFNPDLRWIDVFSDIAFLTMDLDYHNKNQFSNLFLNRYLQETGDYDGLALITFYKIYRALVRAKVSCIRLNQPIDQSERKICQESLEKHIALAHQYIREPSRNMIIIMHGLSGSGKSYIARLLAGETGAICLRSDLERKRIYQPPQEESSNTINTQELYSDTSNKQTYDHLIRTTRKIYSAGYSVIIDAAFLYAWQRELYFDLARELGAPFHILNVHAPKDILEQRINRRKIVGADPSDADRKVLQYQFKNSDTIRNELQQFVTDIDSTNYFDAQKLSKQLNLHQ